MIAGLVVIVLAIAVPSLAVWWPTRTVRTPVTDSEESR